MRVHTVAITVTLACVESPSYVAGSPAASPPVPTYDTNLNETRSRSANMNSDQERSGLPVSAVPVKVSSLNKVLQRPQNSPLVEKVVASLLADAPVSALATESTRQVQRPIHMKVQSPESKDDQLDIWFKNWAEIMKRKKAVKKPQTSTEVIVLEDLETLARLYEHSDIHVKEGKKRLRELRNLKHKTPREESAIQEIENVISVFLAKANEVLYDVLKATFKWDDMRTSLLKGVFSTADRGGDLSTRLVLVGFYKQDFSSAEKDMMLESFPIS